MTPSQLAQKMRNAKTLESMLLQTYHEQELLIRAIEDELTDIYIANDEYKKLVKLYGKNAPQVARAGVRQMLTHEELFNLNLAREDIKRFKFHMEKVTVAAIDGGDVVSMGEMSDALNHDANQFAYRHALMCCIKPEDDIKVDSTLRALAKDNTLPEEIINKFRH